MHAAKFSHAVVYKWFMNVHLNVLWVLGLCPRPAYPVRSSLIRGGPFCFEWQQVCYQMGYKGNGKLKWGYPVDTEWVRSKQTVVMVPIIFQIAPMTVHRFCHFALHAYLKTTHVYYSCIKLASAELEHSKPRSFQK